MKGRYFLVILSVVVCTVWSETELLECYNSEKLNKCIESIQDQTFLRKFFFSTNREELERMCLDLKQEMQCIDFYTVWCVAEEDSRDFRIVFNGTKQFFKKVCDPGPYQEEFLLHASCMRQVSDVQGHCIHQYEQNLRELKAKVDVKKLLARVNVHDWSMTKGTFSEFNRALRAVCCSIHDYEVCFEGKVMRKCGEKAEKFVEDKFNEIYFDGRKEICKIYMHGRGKCPGSSARRNSQRSLLLPIALAMLSLYALLST